MEEGLTVSHAAPARRGQFLEFDDLRCMLENHSYGGSLPKFGIHMTSLRLDSIGSFLPLYHRVRCTKWFAAVEECRLWEIFCVYALAYVKQGKRIELLVHSCCLVPD